MEDFQPLQKAVNSSSPFPQGKNLGKAMEKDAFLTPSVLHLPSVVLRGVYLSLNLKEAFPSLFSRQLAAHTAPQLAAYQAVPDGSVPAISATSVHVPPSASFWEETVLGEAHKGGEEQVAYEL